MKRLTREEVIEKLEKGDKDFSRLDLSGLALNGLDLSGLDLSYTDLSNADLSDDDLYNVNLFYADLYNADLSYANLVRANLSCTNLINAKLCAVDLSRADLSSAYLYNANLKNADLTNAILSNTRLDESEKIRKGIILDKPMTGYKKCLGNIIVTLEIPKNAIVFSINNKQCRTNKAKTIDISNGAESIFSTYDREFIYELGKEMEIKDFDLMYNVECSSGIHFFKTREEAEEY